MANEVSVCLECAEQRNGYEHANQGSFPANEVNRIAKIIDPVAAE